MEFFKKIFDSDFMPHGHCYYWDPAIVWTNAISDSIIAIAYFTIPLSLIYIVRARKDINFVSLVILFAIFILGCGSTHIMDVINIWNPVYRLDSSLRVVTALASIGTAVMLVKITPQILLIPNPDVYKKMNEELQEQISQLKEKDNTIELLKKNKEMQEALKRSEGRLRTMADNIANLAWIANSDGWIFWYNMRWYEYTGKSAEEMEGWGWQSVHDPKELPLVLQKWERSIDTGEPFEMTFPLKGADGIFRPFLTRAMPVMNENGIIESWVGTHTDVTTRVKAEEDLETKNKELKKINDDLDNFVYTASHDLKAPISNIEGLVNSLLDTKGININEEEKTLIEMMNTSILKFKKTISDLTEISKIQREINQDIESITIRTSIDEVTGSINALIKKTDTKIITNLEEVNIRFSERNFKSIIYNLITNAIKYQNPSRTPIIKIRSYKEGDFIILSVEDNGLGIDSSKKHEVFKMFRRLHDHVEGTGIGLYIVKRIIDNAGGKIELETELGNGSTFKVYFK